MSKAIKTLILTSFVLAGSSALANTQGNCNHQVGNVGILTASNPKTVRVANTQTKTRTRTSATGAVQ